VLLSDGMEGTRITPFVCPCSTSTTHAAVVRTRKTTNDLVEYGVLSPGAAYHNDGVGVADRSALTRGPPLPALTLSLTVRICLYPRCALGKCLSEFAFCGNRAFSSAHSHPLKVRGTSEKEPG